MGYLQTRVDAIERLRDHFPPGSSVLVEEVLFVASGPKPWPFFYRVYDDKYRQVTRDVCHALGETPSKSGRLRVEQNYPARTPQAITTSLSLLIHGEPRELKCRLVTSRIERDPDMPLHLETRELAI